MTDSVLLDTHIALWLDTGSERLKQSTRTRIDRCWRGGGTVFLSAVSVWEIALLADMQRIVLDLPVLEWAERFLARPGMASAPLDIEAASRAYDLESFPHRDPADRLLISTSIAIRAPLVTYDKRILAFAKRRGSTPGFAAQN